jgi:nucleoside-diphosphate-sugar epimerase
MSKVCLTGATGFIGSHILEALREREIGTVCLVRKSSDLRLVQECAAETVFGDIRDPQSIREALKNCTAVIHTAALARDWGKREDFFSINVEGTINVLKMCKEAGIKQVLLTGSVSSYGEEHSDQMKDETSLYNSHYPYFLDRVFPSAMNHYRDSKSLATSEACRYAGENGLDLTVLEPVWVYGEREFHTGFYEYVKAVQSGMHLMPGARDNLFHVIYARDLAKAYVLALQKKLPGVHRIIIGNQRAESMYTIFSTFCREAGVAPPHLLPKWAVYPAGFAMECIGSLCRCTRPPLLTRSRINMFYDSISYCTDKAQKLLGFRSEYPLSDAVRRTVGWYKSRNLL